MESLKSIVFLVSLHPFSASQFIPLSFYVHLFCDLCLYSEIVTSMRLAVPFARQNVKKNIISLVLNL